MLHKVALAFNMTLAEFLDFLSLMNIPLKTKMNRIIPVAIKSHWDCFTL